MHSSSSTEARPEATTTWHHVFSFNPGANNYLRTLQKGSHVYVEANYELREADPTADPDSPAGQRQIFLRHGTSPIVNGSRFHSPAFRRDIEGVEISFF